MVSWSTVDRDDRGRKAGGVYEWSGARMQLDTPETLADLAGANGRTDPQARLLWESIHSAHLISSESVNSLLWRSMKNYNINLG
ncbi:hypothetical protein ACLOJK_036092 [Asimina triloba]